MKQYAGGQAGIIWLVVPDPDKVCRLAGPHKIGSTTFQNTQARYLVF